jgi:hypothetical protein
MEEISVEIEILQEKISQLKEKRKRFMEEQEESKKQKVSEEEEKQNVLKNSLSAGTHVIPFGKHTGEKISEIDLSYVVWLAGYRQREDDFVLIENNAAYDFVRRNHSLCIVKAKTYLQWMCWCCSSRDVRFRFSKMCTSCWKLFQ